MTHRLAPASAGLLLLAGGACSSDLFHATDWRTACDADPAAAGCDSPGAGGGGAAVATPAATTSSTSSSAATGVGGAGGGGATCADLACVECVNCTTMDTCKAQTDACAQSSGCLSLAQCLTSCPAGDAACATDCVNQYPDGVTAYADLAACACDVCGQQCKDAGYCG